MIGLKNLKLIELKEKFSTIKVKILNFIKNNNQNFQQEDFRIYYYLLKSLDKIIENLDVFPVLSKITKYAELSRAIIELPSYLIEPELCGEIIEAEKQYVDILNSKNGVI